MRRFLTLLLIVVLGSLAACQPAVAPTAETIVETVVVTQVLEGEVVEVAFEPGAAPDADMLAYVAPSNRLVIKDAEIDLLVEDTDAVVANVTQLAADTGGYIISSQTWFEGEFKYASLRLAVPSDRFESALNTLRIFGQEVLSETASGQDVTAEYVDLDSRLTNLEATADRVRAFLDSAASVEESLAVSEELSALEEEIEQIKGQMRYFEGRAAFSTVTVLVTPERAPAAAPVWSLGATVENAAATLVVLSRGVIDALVWIVIVPGPFLLLAAIGYRIYRKRVRNSPANV
jgi:hypothetical protein